MTTGKLVRVFASALAASALTAIAALGVAASAQAQDKKFKIGVIFDLTGPLAGGGSELQYLGVKIMNDYFIKQGPIEGYTIEAVYADAQSKPDIAINEAVRLMEQEKVNMLAGLFSSAQCVPIAQRVEQAKNFLWLTTCISTGVVEDKHYKYVFRPQASGQQYGQTTTDMVAQIAKANFGKEPKDMRVAIIHEDGAYGVDVAKGNEAGAKKAGMNVVMKEGYSATAPDLSALVTKLKRARPDVIFHTGYNPDISLILRQGREQGLKVGGIIGQGAGYGVYEKLAESLGGHAQYFFNTDPVSIWLANPKAIDPSLQPFVKMVGEELDKLKPGQTIRSAHVGIGASNMYVCVDSEALRKAAIDLDIPEGGTMLGFGVKFAPPESPIAGQNERSYPVVIQYIDDKPYVVWPKSLVQRDVVLPWPAGMTYSYK